MWYRSKVTHGQREGTKINFPTINLSPDTLPDTIVRGVYACLVKIENKRIGSGENLIGALYFGPKFVSKSNNEILEIYLLNFDQDVYGKIVLFKLFKFIRPPIKFNSLEVMRQQISADVAQIRSEINKLETNSSPD